VVVLHINTTVDLTRDELEMLRHIQVQRSQRVTAKQDVPSEDGQAAGSSQKTRQKPKRKGPFRSKKK
jgi:hypothetical protein